MSDFYGMQFNKEIIIDSYPAKLIEALIQFMYTGKTTIPSEETVTFLELANEFLVVDLKLAIEEILKS